MTDEVLRAVVQALSEAGHPAHLEYPGFIVSEIDSERYMSIDDNDATLSFDVFGSHAMDDHSPILAIPSTIPRDSNDVEGIVTRFLIERAGLAIREERRHASTGAPI